MFWRLLTAAAVFLALTGGRAEGQGPGDAEFNKAYKALAQKEYDSAVALFREGLARQPGNAGVHKDLAYTLLKTGDNAEARDEFDAARKLNPKDDVAALSLRSWRLRRKSQLKRGASSTNCASRQT